METDSNRLEVLSRAEAVTLLGTHEVGRLVYTRRALPAVTLVNYAARDGAIWIWTGLAASLAQALRGAVVAFQVDDLDYAARSGWSVTVTGLAEAVTDAAQLARARGEGPVPGAPGFPGYLIRIPLTMVTSRRFDSGLGAGYRADEAEGRGGDTAPVRRPGRRRDRYKR